MVARERQDTQAFVKVRGVQFGELGVIARREPSLARHVHDEKAAVGSLPLRVQSVAALSLSLSLYLSPCADAGAARAGALVAGQRDLDGAFCLFFPRSQLTHTSILLHTFARSLLVFSRLSTEVKEPTRVAAVAPVTSAAACSNIDPTIFLEANHDIIILSFCGRRI